MRGPQVSGKLDDQAAEWFARLRADDVSEADRQAFYAWLISDPAAEYAFIEVLSLWEYAASMHEGAVGVTRNSE